MSKLWQFVSKKKERFVSKKNLHSFPRKTIGVFSARKSIKKWRHFLGSLKKKAYLCSQVQ